MNFVSTKIDPTFKLEMSCLKRWTVQDYHRLSELGLLNVDERTELRLCRTVSPS